MASLTDIANMALSHIGQGDEIQNYLTDSDKEAVVCRRFMQSAIDFCLRDFDWSFAKTYATLDLVEDFSSDPGFDWTFSYRYPPDCLNIKRFITGDRVLTMQNSVPFSVGVDGAGKLVYTDITPARILYIARVDNTEMFPPDFVMALSYYLASMIAPRITAGDEFGASKRCLQMYLGHMSNAKANDANESQMDQRPDAEVIRFREDEGGRLDRNNRFYGLFNGNF